VLDDKLAWLRERAARAQANALISASLQSAVPAVPQSFAPPAPTPVTQPIVPTEPKQRATKEASFQSLANIGLLGIKKDSDDIYLVIALACRSGAIDLTRREIRELAEVRFERRIDSSWISRCVNDLVKAQRVLERPDNRVCTVTGNMVGAVYVVMKQVRLVYQP
jgi:hypothetical protein